MIDSDKSIAPTTAD